MRGLSFLMLGSFALCGAGCSDEAPEHLGRLTAPIINGSPDTVHQAAVAIFMNGGGACSGTIVAVVGNQGYALTAAHCIDGAAPQVVLQGDDYQSNPISYPVVDSAMHPSYQPPLYDFAMVRFTGAGASTPVILPMTAAEDNLAQGSQLDIVGYGQTENGNNSLRRHVVKPLAGQTSLRLFFDQASSGMCFGDSGGPDLAVVGGQERVAGVNQGVENANCTGTSDSGRVSAVTDSFIMPFINGGPVGMQTCDQCHEAATTGVGPCEPVVDACVNSADCSALLSCWDGCSTQACEQGCVTTYPLGYQIYKDIFECTCETACVAECQGDPMCPTPPACGFVSQTMECQTCFEAGCCAQLLACADDNLCSACITTPSPNKPAQCNGYGLSDAVYACIDQSCANECNTGSGSGGAGGAGGTGAGGEGTGGDASGGSGSGGEASGAGGAGSGGESATGGGTSAGSGSAAGSTSGSNVVNDSPDTEGGCASRPGTSDARVAASLAVLLGLLSHARRRRSHRC